MIQTLLLFKYKLLYYHADQILVPITTWSPSALLQIKDLVTKYTTVEWPVVERAKNSYNQIFKEPPFLLVLQDVVKVLIFAVSNKNSVTPKSSLTRTFDPLSSDVIALPESCKYGRDQGMLFSMRTKIKKLFFVSDAAKEKRKASKPFL